MQGFQNDCGTVPSLKRLPVWWGRVDRCEKQIIIVQGINGKLSQKWHRLGENFCSLVISGKASWRALDLGF